MPLGDELQGLDIGIPRDVARREHAGAALLVRCVELAVFVIEILQSAFCLAGKARMNGGMFIGLNHSLISCSASGGAAEAWIGLSGLNERKNT